MNRFMEGMQFTDLELVLLETALNNLLVDNAVGECGFQFTDRESAALTKLLEEVQDA